MQVLHAEAGNAYALLCLNLTAAVTGAHDKSWYVECRFWVLEVVARMPYFAYISMLHLYESLGWWRAGAELRRVSFCLSVCLADCNLASLLALLVSVCTCVTCRLSVCLSDLSVCQFVSAQGG